MKRHMELIGRILAHAERSASCGNIEIPTVEGYSRAEVQYHVKLCVEAGYIEPLLNGGHVAGIDRLTWNGHEALSDLREDYPSI